MLPARTHNSDTISVAMSARSDVGHERIYISVSSNACDGSYTTIFNNVIVPHEGTTYDFTVPTDCPDLKVEFPVDNGDVFITELRFDDYNLMYCAIRKNTIYLWDQWSCSDDPLNPNPNENRRCQSVRDGVFAWHGTYLISSCLSECIPNECT